MFTLGQIQSLRQWDSYVSVLERFRLRDVIHPAKLEDPLPGVRPDRLYFEARAHLLRSTKQINFTYLLKSFRPAAQRGCRQPPTIAPHPSQTGDGDPLVFCLETHSRISSVKRRFSFMPAAPRMVRIERAVRPCLPITLPRSLAATRSSRTVTCSPSTTRTATSSGMSTRAFAISSISCFIPRLLSSF